MSKELSPAFQFYPSDFLSDSNVMRMSMEERGCYITLLSTCWKEQFLPADRDELKLICNGVSVSDRVAMCFESHGDILRHKRLDFERQKQAENRSMKSIAGQKGNDKRWGKRKKTKKIIAVGSHRDNSAIAEASQNVALQSSISSSITNENNSSLPQNYLASSDEKSLSPTSPILFELPCTGKSKIFPIVESFIAEMKEYYPGVDIEQEILRAKGWLVTNSSRGKTFKGMPRFLNSWFSRCQNNGGNGSGKQSESLFSGDPGATSEQRNSRGERLYIPKQ